VKETTRTSAVTWNRFKKPMLSLPRKDQCWSDSSPTRLYKPRRPARSALHRTVRQHLETYLTERSEDLYGPVPGYIETAFRSYLKCGILAYGFARVHCSDCGHDFLVAFSCKGRDVCPSCASRRMAEVAAHLVDTVLPRVPYWQWVLSVPKRVRWHMRTNPAVTSGLLRVFLRAVETTLRQRSPGAPRAARFGAVAFVHRFGSFLNSHVHFHVVVTNGVFSAAGTSGEEAAVFHPALDLTHEDIVVVQGRMRRRGLRYLQRHGHLDQSAIDSLAAADHAGGWSVDASVHIADWDRQGLERLVRYCARQIWPCTPTTLSLPSRFIRDSGITTPPSLACPPR
jgi:hypothetical protein